MKRKNQIILVFILVIVWVSLIYIFSKEEQIAKLQESPQILILDNFFFWKYEDGAWDTLVSDADYDLFNWKKFDIYVNNNYINTFKYVYKNNESFFFNENNESQTIASDDLLLLSEDSYINILNFSELDFDSDDEKIIRKFLKKNSIDYNTITLKIKYSITNDNFLYVLSNNDELVKNEDTFYLFMYRTKYKSYLVTKKMFSYDFSLQSIIDIQNGKPNFIIKYNCYDGGHCYDMYQYVENNYVKVAGLDFEE